MTTTTAILRVMAEHGAAAEVRNGVVWAEAVWTQAPDGEVIIGRTWEAVGTSMREALEWLGY